MRIKEIRKKAKMTQNQLSWTLKIPKNNICNWEQGRTTPPEYLVDLIEYYLLHEGFIKNDK